MTKTYRYALAGSLAALGIAAAAPFGLFAQQAADSTANMQVSANVIRKCTIRADPMAFGNYDPIAANATAPLDTQTTITVTCTKGTTVSVGMDAGTNPLATARRMLGGANSYLGYEVYKDASRTEVWGADGTGMLDGGVAPSRDPRQFIAYGRITGGQDVPEGSFQDTVLVTVDF